MIRPCLAAAIAAMVVAGCGQDSPAAPTSVELGLEGTWTGAASDSSGPGTMSWSLTPSGTFFSGTVAVTEDSTKVTGRGAVSGSVSGELIDFSLRIDAGGFDSPYSDCSATISGTARVTSSQISGTYSGTNSCSGEVASGQLTLNRQ